MLGAGGVYCATETEGVDTTGDVVGDSWNSAGDLADDVVGTSEVVVGGADVASPSTQMVVVIEMVSVTISQVVVQTTSRFSWCFWCRWWRSLCGCATARESDSKARATVLYFMIATVVVDLLKRSVDAVADGSDLDRRGENNWF